jgi:hypothetical protein
LANLDALSLGNAGESPVLARGHHAALTNRNSSTFDILTRFNGCQSALRVKSSSSRDCQWSAKPNGMIFLHRKPGDRTDFVVLVLMPKRNIDNTEFYVVPTIIIDRTLQAHHRRWIKLRSRDGRPHKVDNSRRSYT